MTNTANDEPKLPSEFEKLLVKPLDLPDGEVGRIKFYRTVRKVHELVKKHNELVRLISRGGITREKGKTFPVSDEKAMPSGELQSVGPCSPPSEPRPNSYDDLMTKFCHCVVPTPSNNSLVAGYCCGECG